MRRRREQEKLNEILKENFADLYEWIGIFRGNTEDFVLVNEYDEGKKRIRLYVYTEDRIYYIVAIKPDVEKEDGYLGCQFSNRRQCAGEDWTRGRDLSDGPYSVKTFTEIAFDIASTEFVKLNIQYEDAVPDGLIIEETD